MLLVLHVVSACSALLLGTAALVYPNGTARHRGIGKAYVLAWVGVAATGLALGADEPAPSSFEILTVVGLGCVGFAYAAVLRRRGSGRDWLRRHYSWMVVSLAALVVATANQVLIQTLGDYPRLAFWALVLSPFVFLPPAHRALDRRYGFAPERA